MKNIWLSFALNGSVFSIIFLLASMNSRVTKLLTLFVVGRHFRSPLSMLPPKVLASKRGTGIDLISR